jgi:hypothetical protein
MNMQSWRYQHGTIDTGNVDGINAAKINAVTSKKACLMSLIINIVFTVLYLYIPSCNGPAD